MKYGLVFSLHVKGFYIRWENKQNSNKKGGPNKKTRVRYLKSSNKHSPQTF